MSLFYISRYLGDEEHKESNDESRSKALLAKLQMKVKNKEKQSEVQTCPGKVSTKKKRKFKEEKYEATQWTKRKRGDETQTESWTASNNIADQQSPAEEKKKKKKREGQNEPLKNLDAGIQKGLSSSPDDRLKENEGGGKDIVQQLEGKDSEQESSVQTSFKVLGGFEKKTVEKVQRVLPQWLAQPDVIHRDIRSNLVPIGDVQGIATNLMKKLESSGINQFFPVQAEVIPAILESVSHGLLIGRGGCKPRDICVSAPTGSGKTLAFVIPIVQVLMERVVCRVRALAVLPTKELAQQVSKVFTSYAQGTPLKVVMLAGQKSLAAEQASLSENRGGTNCSLADIVVATPGRLVDHINKNPGFNLEHLRFLVIDEADRMIDSMHQSWLGQVTKAVYRSEGGPDAASIFGRTEPSHVTAASLSPPQMPLQKLLFSATLTQNPEKLQQLGLHLPRLFSSLHGCTSSQGTGTSQTQERFNFPQGLTEYYVPCTLGNKPLLMLHFILRMKFSPILCFINSRDAAHRLYLFVKLFGGVQVAEFSSRLSPNERRKTLKDFQQGKIQLLISTDAASRGIDIDGVKFVVNYDAPQYIRTYIHRIGRTARAGKAGLAFTFLFGVQEKNFLQMVMDAGSPGIQKQIVPPGSLKRMEVRYQQTLQELGNVVQDEMAMNHV